MTAYLSVISKGSAAFVLMAILIKVFAPMVEQWQEVLYWVIIASITIANLFALRQQNKLHIYCEPFADPLLLPRADRQQALQHAIDRYAERLEHYALQSPLDWFNFFDFWRLPDTKNKE